MTFEIAQPWLSSDKSVYLVHKYFSDDRQGIEVYDKETGKTIPNDTIAANEADWVAGQNCVYNDAQTK